MTSHDDRSSSAGSQGAGHEALTALVRPPGVGAVPPTRADLGEVNAPPKATAGAQQQHDGIRMLLALANPIPATSPTAPAGGHPSAFTSIDVLLEDGHEIRDHLAKHRQRGYHSSRRHPHQGVLETREAIRGALNSRYEIPEVTFDRKRGRGLTLTFLLLAGIVCWRLFNNTSLYLLLCAAPALATRICIWLISWLDKPVSVTARQQAQLDRLHVTVAVPCFNEDPIILDRCLYALVNQTRLPQLVWVVDDGSWVDYDRVQHYWEGIWPGGPEIRWSRQVNQGKRRAHAVVFGNVPETDIVVTVDSDTTLTFNAIEEGLKPFISEEVMSVAGIEHGYNALTNFLTRLQGCLQLFAQAVIGSSWSVFGDMYTNRGPFALYRAELIQRILPLYRDEFFFGRRVILGDDSLLALAGSTYGKSVQQLTAFGLTMWPETLPHHIRQRVRWARGRTMRNFWRIKYRPLVSFCWWYTVCGIYTFLSSTALVVVLIAGWPGNEGQVGHDLVALCAIALLISPRVLCIRASNETRLDRLMQLILRPVAGLWSSLVLARIIRLWGTVTVLRQGWTTRQHGPEFVMTAAELEAISA